MASLSCFCFSKPNLGYFSLKIEEDKEVKEENFMEKIWGNLLYVLFQNGIVKSPVSK